MYKEISDNHVCAHTHTHTLASWKSQYETSIYAMIQIPSHSERGKIMESKNNLPGYQQRKGGVYKGAENFKASTQ